MKRYKKFAHIKKEAECLAIVLMPGYVFNRKKLADTGITMHERDQRHPALFQCTLPDDLTIVKVDEQRQHIVRDGIVIAHVYVYIDGSECQGYLRIL